MPTSTLELTYTDYVAVARRAMDASATDAELDIIIGDALRLFYYHTPEGYVYSFLQREGIFTIGGAGSPDEGEFFLLDDDFSDFAGVIGRPTVGTPAGTPKLEVVSPEQIKASKTGDDSKDIGEPKYVSFRRLGPSSSAVDEWVAHFYPRPAGTAHVIRMIMKIAPPAIGPDVVASRPLGGTMHSETIKAAIYAAAELFEMEGVRGPRWETFMGLQATSAAYDSKMNPVTAPSVWPVAGESDTLDQTFVDIALQIGAEAGHGTNPDAWSDFQLSDVKALFNRGYRRFLSADQWKFQYPIARMTVNEESNLYDLPADFGLVLFDFTYLAEDHVGL